MKPIAVAVSLALSLSPLATRAQSAEPQPPASTPGAPTAAPSGPWSLGAGAGYLLPPMYVASARFYGGGLTPAAAPSARASLERAVAPGWWVELGVSGGASRQRGDAPAGSGGVTRGDWAAAALNLGLRRALTRPGAPVCVSVDLGLHAGYQHSRSDAAFAPARTERGEALLLGLAAGLAVERELTAGLSLRVGTSLAAAAWSRAWVESTSSGKVTRNGLNATAELSPWLELRQAF